MQLCRRIGAELKKAKKALEDHLKATFEWRGAFHERAEALSLSLGNLSQSLREHHMAPRPPGRSQSSLELASPVKGGNGSL